MPEGSLRGDALLEAITAAMVSLHVRYYGREPGSAKTQLMGDDLLACVLGNMYTDVEKTMIEIERGGVMKATRSAFQEAMQHRFVEEVERLSGGSVRAFVSDHHVGPDLEVELFFMEEPLTT